MAKKPKKPMNKYLKGALWGLAILIIVIGALFLMCNGIINTIFEIGTDLGVGAQ